MTAKPFKQTDIRNCAACDRGLMHAGNPLGMFWRLRFDRLMIDRNAVSRQHGLELMMGGAAPLAHVMGPQEDMAQPVGGPYDAMICEECVLSKPLVVLFQVAEKAAEAEPAIEHFEIVNMPVKG
jgi:hypothetical protein